INGHDYRGRNTATEFERNLGGAGADVENGVVPVPDREEVRDEESIDRGVVHRVVIAGFLGRIHHLGFETARQHSSTRCGQASTSSAVRWTGWTVSWRRCRSASNSASSSWRSSKLVAPRPSHSRM